MLNTIKKMNGVEFNYRQDRKIPINRNNLFFSEESFQFEVELGKSYLEQVTNQTVVLYEVDLEKSNLDSVYNESKKDSLIFKTPVEIHCTYNIQPGELQSYEKSKNLGVYVKTGKLTVNVYQATLDELGCEIKIGDYIGVNVNGDSSSLLYFCVNDDGRNNFENSKSIFGYKNPWRTIIAASTTLENSEFN